MRRSSALDPRRPSPLHQEPRTFSAFRFHPFPFVSRLSSSFPLFSVSAFRFSSRKRRTPSIANIANPIYDGAFKYLLDDNKIAKLFLSALIGSEIIELEFRPTEVNQPLPLGTFTVFRMDFSAKVRTQDGSSKMILIEIQKAKLPEDVMRFRKYPGNQYASPDNVVTLKEEPARFSTKSAKGSKSVKPLEIFTIYFLGHPLQHTKEPVVWVRRELYGLGGDPTRRIKGVHEEFIDALTHDSIVVQIPYLRERRRTDLEKLLSIFDQTQQMPGNEHLLSLPTDEIPERYAAVVRRLAKAAARPEVQKDMELEDDFVRGMEAREREALRKVERARQREARERKLKEEALKREKEARQREEEERRLKEEALKEIDSLRKFLKPSDDK